MDGGHACWAYCKYDRVSEVMFATKATVGTVAVMAMGWWIAEKD